MDQLLYYVALHLSAGAVITFIMLIADIKSARRTGNPTTVTDISPWEFIGLVLLTPLFTFLVVVGGVIYMIYHAIQYDMRYRR